MSHIKVLQNRIESLKARIKDETDDERRVHLYDDLCDAEDELRFIWKELEEEIEHEQQEC